MSRILQILSHFVYYLQIAYLDLFSQFDKINILRDVHPINKQIQLPSAVDCRMPGMKLIKCTVMQVLIFIYLCLMILKFIDLLWKREFVITKLKYILREYVDNYIPYMEFIS